VRPRIEQGDDRRRRGEFSAGQNRDCGTRPEWRFDQKVDMELTGFVDFQTSLLSGDSYFVQGPLRSARHSITEAAGVWVAYRCGRVLRESSTWRLLATCTIVRRAKRPLKRKKYCSTLKDRFSDLLRSKVGRINACGSLPPRAVPDANLRMANTRFRERPCRRLSTDCTSRGLCMRPHGPAR
jgi:hypothetical protein